MRFNIIAGIFSGIVIWSYGALLWNTVKLEREVKSELYKKTFSGRHNDLPEECMKKVQKDGYCCNKESNN